MTIVSNSDSDLQDVFWTSRGLIRPPVLADALAQGHAILQREGHQTQTQTHKSRSRLNSVPSLHSGSEMRSSADARRSVSGQGLPSAGRIGNTAVTAGAPENARRRASIAGPYYRPPSGLSLSDPSSLITKEEVDLRANMMNPNNSVFWTSRGLVRPTDLQDALKQGHAILEAEGHTTHGHPGGRRGSTSSISSLSGWGGNRRGSRTELHAPPVVSPLVAAAQRQWSTPFLAPNAGAPLAPQTRAGALPGAGWIGGGAAMPTIAMNRHPDWQPIGGAGTQRRRYSLPPPGFELFTPPTHFQPSPFQGAPLAREGAADTEWETMDEAAIAARKVLAPPPSSAVPIIKPPSSMAKNEEWQRRPVLARSGDKINKVTADKDKQAKDEQQKMKKEDKGEKNEEKGEESAKPSDSAENKEQKSSPSGGELATTAPSSGDNEGPMASSGDSKSLGDWEDRVDLLQDLKKIEPKVAGEARVSENSSQSATV